MSNSRVPEPAFPYRHTIDVQLRFNDVDMFGHVNNSVYLQFFDLAKLEYFRAVMGEDFEVTNIAVVVVNVNCDFYAPTFIDEKLQVMTTTLRVGERSMLLEQRIVNSVTGDVKCVGRTIMSGFDVKTSTSAPIDDNWRSRLETYENRSFVIEK